MNKELLRQAFEAGRSWQFSETAEYNGGNENEKPNFNEWYESQVKKLNIPDVSLPVCNCYNTECMHQRGMFCMAAQFNCEDRQTGS